MPKKFSVLIVEDDFLIASFMADLVEDAGGTVLGPANSAEAALLLIATFEPDAALLDINVVDGLIYPVAKQLRDIGCRFAFVSAMRRLDLPEEFTTADLIKKPASPEAVERWLRAATAI